MNHLWTLIHMHVGAPCRIKDLDKLSDDVFNLGYRGTYKICVYYLASNSHGYCSTSWIARKLKIRAAEIRKGVLLYKKQLLLDKTNLSPMKLGYLGIERSMKLWRDGGELTSSVWGETDPVFAEDLLDPDLEIDAIRCTACKKVEEGTNLMLECACKCVLYCSKACQKGNWKGHRRLCKWRMGDTDVVYNENICPNLEKTTKQSKGDSAEKVRTRLEKLGMVPRK